MGKAINKIKKCSGVCKKIMRIIILLFLLTLNVGNNFINNIPEIDPSMTGDKMRKEMEEERRQREEDKYFRFRGDK